MAHSSAPIAVAPIDALAFRRADGSRREFFFDDSASSLQHLATSLLHRPALLPRNVMRPFRRDNDEPATSVSFLRETRQSVCRDGRDRSRCSVCHQRVHRLSSSYKSSGRETGSPLPHSGFMMSPQRVFRDLVMSDVAEPMPPALRDALLDAFNATTTTTTTTELASEEKQHQKPHMAIPLPFLPSPPPSPKCASSVEVQEDKPSSSCCPPTEFHYFPLLPYEIRRMVWEQALPFRVLLRDDLGQTTYRGLRRVFRPASHKHTIETLWRSDLFYTCVEARRVVEAFARDDGGRGGGGRDGRGGRGGLGNSRDLLRMLGEEGEGQDDLPMAPLLMSVSSRTRLRAGLDVLYYPWLGSESTRDPGGGGGGGSRRIPGGHQQQHQQHHGPGQYPGNSSSYNNINSDRYASSSWMSKFDDAATATSGSSSNSNSSNTAASNRRIAAAAAAAAAPITAVPYGYWASQLRLLRLPVSSVALDAAWIDKAHPDTVAWAAGVDLSLPEDEEETGGGNAGQKKGDDEDDEEAAPPPPPSSLQLVVADILVPVRIRLDRCAVAMTPTQQHLLTQNIAPQSWLDTSFPRGFGRTPEGLRPLRHPYPQGVASTGSRRGVTRGVSPGSPTPSDFHYHPPPPANNLNGMDFTVLVDLYDDWRIEELLSLQGSRGGGASSSSQGQGEYPLNKAAHHRCIACTRRAWEEREDRWTGKFGPLLGTHLKRLCRPTIVFSVVLEFE